MVHQRWHYENGVEHGRYEDLYQDGTPRLVGDYEQGRPHGRWTCRRHDGSLAVEVDYEHGVDKHSRLLLPDGKMLVPGEIGQIRDILSWSGLADAWFETLAGTDDTGGVRACVDNWTDERKHIPLQWIRARIDAGEQPRGGWMGSTMGWGEVLMDRDDDPRLDWIDGLEVDHSEMTEAQMARVIRRSRQLTSLSFSEAEVEPSIAALLRPPADWSQLESLMIEECGDEADLVALASIHLPALRSLTLRGIEVHHERAPNIDWRDAIAPTMLALTRASFWTQLRSLELRYKIASPATLIEMANQPMPNLEQLDILEEDTLDKDDDDDDHAREQTEAVRAAWYAPVLRPKLRMP
jgi:hypothetical protein